MIVACVGDCGVDRYVDSGLDRPGGITLNFAVNAKRCFEPDARVVVVTAVGDDPEGRLVCETVERLGLEGCVTVAAGRTPVQRIRRAGSGERRFVGYDEGVLASYRMGVRERALLADSDLLVTPVYAQITGLFASVMAIDTRGLRVVDFSDLADFGADTRLVEEYIDAIDVGFFGLGPDDGPLIRDLGRLAVRHHKLFVVTLGAAGSLALTESGETRCAAAPVERVVDTTGAGDTFAAGFLAEFCRTKDLTGALERGSREAAASVQRVGAF